MWGTEYIKEIQRQFIDVYNFPASPENQDLPADVPDGVYPMTIQGRLDYVGVKDGYISCANFAESHPTSA
jgi:hypothetical protein